MKVNKSAHVWKTVGADASAASSSSSLFSVVLFSSSSLLVATGVERLRPRVVDSRYYISAF